MCRRRADAVRHKVVYRSLKPADSRIRKCRNARRRNGNSPTPKGWRPDQRSPLPGRIAVVRLLQGPERIDRTYRDLPELFPMRMLLSPLRDGLAQDDACSFPG